jgi:hypothetical protein
LASIAARLPLTRTSSISTRIRPSSVPSGDSSTCEQPIRLPARAAARISIWLRSEPVIAAHAEA